MRLNLLFILCLGLASRFVPEAVQAQACRFSVYSENRLHSKVLVEPYGVSLTVPKTWSFSSECLAFEQTDIAAIGEDVLDRFDLSLKDYLVTSYLGSTSGNAIAKLVSLRKTERFDSELKPDWIRDLSESAVELSIIRDDVAEDFARNKLDFAKTRLDENRFTVSSKLSSFRSGGHEMFQYFITEMTPLSARISVRRISFYQIGNDVLVVHMVFDSNCSKRQLQEMDSFLNRISFLSG